MRRFIRVLLLVCFSGNFLGLFAQETTTRTGFAVVTVVSGNLAGLIATETLRNETDSFEQTVVPPSPLVTTASMLVRVGPVGGDTTAIAIANPSVNSGGVNLILTDSLGRVVLNSIVNLGPQGQISRFLSEFFPTQPAGFTAPLLLTISSEIPVALLAFNFRGSDFAPIPLTSLTQTFGGAGTLVFAQVATGTWSTEITIGNTSAGLQAIRIDFFGSDGISRSSLTDIVIPPRGVFSFATNGASEGIQ